MSGTTIPNDAGHSASIWMDAKVAAWDDPMPAETNTDVCIVGAGMAGLSIAHALAERNVRVLLLDDGPICGGESARSSAHLAAAIDGGYAPIEHRFGRDAARLVASSHAAAIDAIEANVERLGIDCAFRRVDGHLLAPPDGTWRELEREMAAASRAGLQVERLDRAPLPFDTGACVRYTRQAEFHPVAYLRRIAEDFVARGGQIRTGVHVLSVERHQGLLRLSLSGHRVVHARTAVDATNASITSLVRLPIRQAAYRTYCVAFDIAPGSVPHALHWEHATPYHYLRVASDASGRERLIVGGEDHKTAQDPRPEQRWQELESWTRTRFLQIGGVAARWSGQILEPSDGLAYIGRSPDLDQVYVVTGHTGNGLTYAMIAALMLPDLIGGRDHAWQALYEPRRSALRALGTLVREAANSTTQYFDWLKPGEVSSSSEVEPGGGAIVRRGMRLIAVCRDDRGACIELSARCPHLGAVVAWNAAERTWDCPAHGSRFDEHGRVINGPACKNLAPAESAEALAAEREPTSATPVPGAAPSELGLS